MLPMRTCGRLVAVAGALLLLLAPEARSTTLVQMNLADLAGRANKIFRGTVLSVKPGTVAAGGGELPILIYRVRVDEKFKGEFGEGKQADFVEIRMVGAIKEPKRADNLRKFSLWRDVPAPGSGPGIRALHHHPEPDRPLHHRGPGPGHLPDPRRGKGRDGRECLRKRGPGQGYGAEYSDHPGLRSPLLS